MHVLLAQSYHSVVQENLSLYYVSLPFVFSEPFSPTAYVVTISPFTPNPRRVRPKPIIEFSFAFIYPTSSITCSAAFLILCMFRAKGIPLPYNFWFGCPHFFSFSN